MCDISPSVLHEKPADCPAWLAVPCTAARDSEESEKGGATSLRASLHAGES